MRCLKCLRLAAVSLAIAVLAPGLARAAWPERAITIVVPYTPGGTADVLARRISRDLTKAFGQPLVIDNKPGTGGSLGAEVVARAQPDGYTLLLSTNSPLTTNPFLYKSLGYDTLKDFEPIVIIGETPNLLVANPKLEAGTVKELVDLAKAKPGALSCGTSGNGSTTHLSLAEFNRLADVKIEHVPYRGGVPSLTGAISGEVQITFSDITPALPLFKDGKLKALGSTGSRRAGIAPEIPTLAEQGLAGFNIVAWLALVAPHGTPPAVVARLNGEVNRLLGEQNFRQEIMAQGIDPLGGSAADFAGVLKSEIPRWQAIVSSAGITVQ